MARRKVGATIQAPKTEQPKDWKQSMKQAMTLLIVVVIFGGGVYLHQADTLPVKHVTVEGELRHTDKDGLVAAVSPLVRGSFVDVDVAGIRQAGEALPWVKQIQVRRVWPDTLHLVVEEHKAIARWNEDGLVNTSGAVFFPAQATLPKGLVQLNGPNGTSELMARRLVDIQGQVDSLDLRVTAISMDKRRAWQVDFKGGLHLKLGRADGDLRLSRFITVYGSSLNTYSEQIKEVDMRYTNGLAVVWQDGQQPDFNGTV
ncbi:Cell division protein FtsQ [Methylophaga thiooxydans]|uniref:Cell division protein FtsQ n=1 Tax=Methylophaga thiooxydans TaxID=392484 RepID=A0A0A0BG33_9GAMM|nr:cell division protein FtsQ/DivIB [Methylophaga thiooxydans]KGM06632.1 Cell division protein FtsQ [Methylophaga thiooxydans]